LLASITSGAVQLCGVLDFEGALAGDPLIDVAKALYYLGDEPRHALLEGYGGMARVRIIALDGVDIGWVQSFVQMSVLYNVRESDAGGLA
jgi:aminoglycoside phosphotransferase (APT) family kinase protein